MATRSFTAEYKVEKSDVKTLRNIIKDERKLRIRKVKRHKDLKGKEMLRLLGLKNDL